jgi:hypothetical protein
VTAAALQSPIPTDGPLRRRRKIILFRTEHVAQVLYAAATAQVAEQNKEGRYEVQHVETFSRLDQAMEQIKLLGATTCIKNLNITQRNHKPKRHQWQQPFTAHSTASLSLPLSLSLSLSLSDARHCMAHHGWRLRLRVKMRAWHKGWPPLYIHVQLWVASPSPSQAQQTRPSSWPQRQTTHCLLQPCHGKWGIAASGSR